MEGHAVVRSLLVGYNQRMRQGLGPGQNPRNALSHHRERGEEALLVVRFSTIAAAAGCSVATVKKAAVQRRLNPRDLASVAAFIIARRPDLRGSPSAESDR